MKNLLLCFVLIIFCSCNSENVISKKKFPPITLINKIEFYDASRDWDKIGCGFLLKYRQDTFVVSAKHILSVIKTDSMKYLTIQNHVKKWSLRPLNKEGENVVTERLLNENKNESLAASDRFVNDWLVFSIKENNSKVQAVELREAPLKEGQKLYVVGWTRHMTDGEQRVYEFEY